MAVKSVCLVFALSLISAGGCTSYFKRKECEAVNWFEHGHKVAMEGRRLSGDQLVVDCRRVEAEFSESELDRGFKGGMAKYCLPQTVYEAGKKGELFSSEMCDGENPRLLQERHRLGVSEYCQKANGYTAGTAGHPYNKICPAELEKAFLPEFKRGRKKYLGALLVENEKKIIDLDREILSLERERNLKSVEAQQLQFLMTAASSRSVQVADEHKRRADEIRWQIQGIDSRIRSKQMEQAAIRDENRKINLEIVSHE